MKELLFNNIIEKEALENILALNQIKKCDKEIEKYTNEINDQNEEMIRILNEETVIEIEKVQWEGTATDPTYKKKGLQMIIMDEFTKSPLHGHFGNAYGLRSFMLYNENGGIIFLCNGANFITDEEHMTIVQKQIITHLVEKTRL